MSTKIWNAYECDFKTIDELQEKLVSLRPKIREVLLDKCYRRIAYDWAHYVDVCTLEKKTITKKFWDIASEVRKKYRDIKSTRTRNTIYDFYFELVIIPYNGKQYLKIFCEYEFQGMSALFEEFAKDFYYQNSTDRPKEISEKEWKRREETWDKILEKFNIWNEIGLIYDYSLNEVYDIPFSVEEVKSYLPTLEERAEDVAMNRVVFDRCPKNAKGSEVMKAIDYARTEEGKKEIKQVAAEILPKLITDIAKHDFEEDTTPDVKDLKTEDYDVIKKHMEFSKNNYRFTDQEWDEWLATARKLRLV